MPSCLLVSSVFPLSLSWWTLFSLSSSQNILTKLFIYLLLSLTHGNNHGFFFWVKNSCKALYCHRVVPAPFFFFFFFFLSKKISQKHSLPKRNFCLKLSRTVMRVQRLTEYYGWSFNNGDLVLWVCNVFIFFKIKIALTWTVKTVHGSQIGWFNHGLNGSLLFLLRTVSRGKRTVIVRGSRFS